MNQESTANLDPLPSQFTLLNNIAPELAFLQDLANRGSWRSVLDKVARARSLSILTKPHDHLTCLSYNALALAKLRRFPDTSTEFDSLDDLISPEYKYETYPQIYPNRSGSMVPFILRWLYARNVAGVTNRPWFYGPFRPLVQDRKMASYRT